MGDETQCESKQNLRLTNTRETRVKLASLEQQNLDDCVR